MKVGRKSKIQKSVLPPYNGGWKVHINSPKNIIRNMEKVKVCSVDEERKKKIRISHASTSTSLGKCSLPNVPGEPKFRITHRSACQWT
jgi:hypothetical protein